MKKDFWRWYALYVLVLILILFLVLQFCNKSELQPQVVGSVVDKYEANGKYFVEIQTEITADEYIGYDIGDGYTIRKAE